MQQTLPGIHSSYCSGVTSLLMWTMNVHSVLAHLSNLSSYLPAVLVTVGIAVLIGCAVGCMCEPCEEKDDLFHQEVM